MVPAAGGQLDFDVERLIHSIGEPPEPSPRPVLVVVSGLPGTGKTYFSARLAEKLNFIVLESDASRKLLFPSPVYSSEESSYLFQVIHRSLEQLLKKGISVILDATNLSESHREHLYHIADKCQSRLILVEVTAPPEMVYRRLEERNLNRHKGDDIKSDADWSVYQRMATNVDKIRRQHYSVDTSQDILPAVEKIVRSVKRYKRSKY